MLPSAAIVISALAYLFFMCALGAATGILIALLLRRRPSRRDMLIDFALAGLAALVSAILPAVYYRARGLTMSEPPSLIPIAVGSVAVRHIVEIIRQRK